MDLLYLNGPPDRLEEDETGLWRTSWDADVSATGCQNSEDIIKHGFDFLLQLCIVVANDAVKGALIENAEEWLLNYLRWLGYIHLSVYNSKKNLIAKDGQLTIHFFENLMCVAHVIDDDWAEIDICDVKVAFLVELGAYIAQATS